MGETGEESMKHMCRFCNKSFSCGRSLGGHMRSHVINSTDQYHDHHVKKISCEGVLDKLCKECGKGFQSWKALFGHMKCHSLKNKKIASLNQDSWISQLDNKNSDAKNGPMRRSRSRSSLVSEIEQEQEAEAEVAMSLMMLSRDMGTRCSKSSVLVNLRKVEGKDFIIKNGSKMKKFDETEVGFDFLERSEVGLIKINGIGLGFGGLKDSNKRKFECVTCDKSFHSHQALCGHKASHQKVLKRDFDSKIQSGNKIKHEPVLDHDQTINGYDSRTSYDHQESSSFNLDVGSLKKKKTVALRAHACPICFKVFTSGQALGGHKRSHFNQENNTNVINKPDEPVHEACGFLDLNMLPKEEEEEMNMSSSTTEYKSYCWEDSSGHHSQQSRILCLLSIS
ncbi:zinc finger protein ZAT9-like [Bidens hawaiensis]|uniref:zinc finger protein ZAT9-like n=1 Tax=Bidens hawaiensis TaxID=980011 RepID=UPI00404A8B0E